MTSMQPPTEATGHGGFEVFSGEGWNERTGILSMRLHDKRHLSYPGDHAYGKALDVEAGTRPYSSDLEVPRLVSAIRPLRQFAPSRGNHDNSNYLNFLGTAFMFWGICSKEGRT